MIPVEKVLRWVFILKSLLGSTVTLLSAVAGTRLLSSNSMGIL